MNVSDTLNRAADLIEERGWARGGTVADPWGANGGAACLEGALMAAVGLPRGEEFYTCPAHDAVADYLGRSPQPSCGPVKDALWQWNDIDGRTAAEVIEVLRAAAVIAASREQDAAWATYTELVSA